MISSLILSTFVAATPGQVKLASPGFNYVKVEEEVGTLFADYFARQLEAEGVSVITPQGIAALLGMERQKQLLGCADESSSCVAELAGAMGVDGVITGTIGQVGTGFTLNLKVTRSADASTIAVYSTRRGTEDEVLDWLAETARDLAGRMNPSGRTTTRQRAWIPAMASGVLLAVGGVSLWHSKSIHDDITGADPQEFSNADALRARADEGRTFQTTGYVLLGLGVAALGGSALMYALGGEEPVQATAFAGPGQAGILVGGRF